MRVPGCDDARNRLQVFDGRDNDVDLSARQWRGMEIAVKSPETQGQRIAYCMMEDGRLGPVFVGMEGYFDPIPCLDYKREGTRGVRRRCGGITFRYFIPSRPSSMIQR